MSSPTRNVGSHVPRYIKAPESRHGRRCLFRPHLCIFCLDFSFFRPFKAFFAHFLQSRGALGQRMMKKWLLLRREASSTSQTISLPARRRGPYGNPEMHQIQLIFFLTHVAAPCPFLNPRASPGPRPVSKICRLLPSPVFPTNGSPR